MIAMTLASPNTYARPARHSLARVAARRGLLLGVFAMAQTKEGALLCAANKIGVAVEEYKAKRDAGLKFCMLCREWHSVAEFGKDAHRHDGLASACKKSRQHLGRKRYTPKPRERGRRFVPVRDGDKKQARYWVNHLIRVGILPRPNDVPCADCGHEFKTGERRHEYDHFMGYTAQHHETVEAVCTRCHARRTALLRKEAISG